MLHNYLKDVTVGCSNDEIAGIYSQTVTAYLTLNSETKTQKNEQEQNNRKRDENGPRTERNTKLKHTGQTDQ